MRQLILDTFRRAAGTQQLRRSVDALEGEVARLLGGGTATAEE